MGSSRLKATSRAVACAASACVLALTAFSYGAGRLADSVVDNVAAEDILHNADGPDPSGDAGAEGPPISDKPTARPLNIILAGSDSRANSGDQYGDKNVYAGERSDTTILLHVSADRSWAKAVSIPRDTWVTLPDCPIKPGIPLDSTAGREAKFNAAYDWSGPGCTVKLVEQMTGLRVDHFAVIDFEGFKAAVDELGGVPICLNYPLYDRSAKLDLPAGDQILNGEQSLAFVRARKAVGDGGDISRISRQQVFLRALIDTVSGNRLITDPASLYRFIEAASNGLTVDKGLATKERMLELAAILLEVPPQRVKFVTMPWTARGDGENVVMSEEAASLWEQLKADALPKPSKKIKDDFSRPVVEQVCP